MAVPFLEEEDVSSWRFSQAKQNHHGDWYTMISRASTSGPPVLQVGHVDGARARITSGVSAAGDTPTGDRLEVLLELATLPGAAKQLQQLGDRIIQERTRMSVDQARCMHREVHLHLPLARFGQMRVRVDLPGSARVTEVYVLEPGSGDAHPGTHLDLVGGFECVCLGEYRSVLVQTTKVTCVFVATRILVFPAPCTLNLGRSGIRIGRKL